MRASLSCATSAAIVGAALAVAEGLADGLTTCAADGVTESSSSAAPASTAHMQRRRSVTGNAHAIDPQSRHIDTAMDVEIIGWHQRLEHIDQVARDGKFRNRASDFAIHDTKA